MKLWLQTNNIMIWILLCSAVVIVALQQWIEFGEKRGDEGMPAVIFWVMTFNLLPPSSKPTQA